MKQGLILAILCTGGILFLTDCNALRGPLATPESLEQLVEILKEPDSSRFSFATSQLAKMGSAAAPAAPILAQALRYPRRDSYMAGVALVAIGPAAGSAIPYLIEALEDNRPDIRRFAAFVLGTIGESSSCAVPKLAARLWDSEAWVRSAAAGALEAITGIDLVVETHELKPSHPGSVFADEPGGSITGKARTWWIEQGQHMDWSDATGHCNLDG